MDTLNKYYNASLHCGHSIQEINSKMAPYIFTIHNGYCQIDLRQTFKLLFLAKQALAQKLLYKAKILLVGTNPSSRALVKKFAQEFNHFYINHHWPNGLLTNWITLFKTLKKTDILSNSKIKKLKEKKNKTILYHARKNVIKYFSGLEGMTMLPHLVIFTSQIGNDNALNECWRLGIPSICILDTNANPDFVTYPIPANDDSYLSINLILTELFTKKNY